MEQNEKKKNFKLIAIIIAAILVIAAAVVAIVIINSNKEEQINEVYFHSTDTRLVYEPHFSNEEQYHGAKRVFNVYSIDGQTVTGYTVFYEYDDNYSASRHSQELYRINNADSAFEEVKQYNNYVAVVFRDDNMYVWTTDTLRQYINDKESTRNQEGYDEYSEV